MTSRRMEEWIPATVATSPEEIARRSGSSFLVSFSALTGGRRAALTAVYAYCRVVDDAVDDCDSVEQGRAELGFWREDLARAQVGEARSAVCRALTAAMRDHGVERGHLDNVAEGCARDLDPCAIATQDDLESYCYLVASSVGLACLPLFGAQGPAAERFADHLGHALQLTNILRDQRHDAEIGRVYVPGDWLSELGVDPAWLTGRGPDAAYAPGGPMAALAARLVARARARFAAAETELDSDPVGELRARLVPARIMGAVYRDLLDRLERAGGNICRSRRIRVPRWRKLLIARRIRRDARRS